MGNLAGQRFYGIAVAVLGVDGLVYRCFADVWQPVPADLSGRAALAVGVACLLVVCGLTIAMDWAGRFAAPPLVAVFGAFSLLWALKIVDAPTTFVYWLGCAEQFALAAGALLIPGFSKDRILLRGCLVTLFGLCAFLFGTAHLVYLAPTAAMVPAWLPGGQRFWAVATALVDFLAGVMIIGRRAPSLASAAVGSMFAAFGVLVWLPMLVKGGDLHFAIAGTSLTFALAGTAWMVAVSIPKLRPTG